MLDVNKKGNNSAAAAINELALKCYEYKLKVKNDLLVKYALENIQGQLFEKISSYIFKKERLDPMSAVESKTKDEINGVYEAILSTFTYENKNWTPEMGDYCGCFIAIYKRRRKKCISEEIYDPGEIKLRKKQRKIEKSLMESGEYEKAANLNFYFTVDNHFSNDEGDEGSWTDCVADDAPIADEVTVGEEAVIRFVVTMNEAMLAYQKRNKKISYFTYIYTEFIVNRIFEERERSDYLCNMPSKTFNIISREFAESFLTGRARNYYEIKNCSLRPLYEFTGKDSDRDVPCGFGAVKCEYIPEHNRLAKTDIFKADSDEVRIKYTIKLTDNVMIPGAVSDQTMDFIPGTSVLGFFANAYLESNSSDNEFEEIFLKNNVCFSNLYISDKNGKEYFPAPVILGTIKGEKGAVNIVTRERDEKIVKPVKTGYTDFSANIVKPLTETVYHHSRSDEPTLYT